MDETTKKLLDIDKNTLVLQKLKINEELATVQNHLQRVIDHGEVYDTDIPNLIADLQDIQNLVVKYNLNKQHFENVKSL